MKLAHEISVSAKNGTDPHTNSSLRLAIAKARAKSMPMKKIEKAIQSVKSKGNFTEGLTEYVFEGYLPHGVSVIVQCLSGNHNRVTANIKNIFSKSGGSLAKKGAVQFLFKKVGSIKVSRTMPEDTFLKLALDAGADDVVVHDDFFQVFTQLQNTANVKNTLSNLGVKEFLSVEFVFLPKTKVKVLELEKEKILQTLKKFKDYSEVKTVFHNTNIEQPL